MRQLGKQCVPALSAKAPGGACHGVVWLGNKKDAIGSNLDFTPLADPSGQLSFAISTGCRAVKGMPTSQCEPTGGTKRRSEGPPEAVEAGIPGARPALEASEIFTFPIPHDSRLIWQGWPSKEPI